MTPFIQRAVAWLRAGYPNGVPEQDYIPLMALLRRRLGDEEIDELGAELVRSGMVPADKIDVGVGITKVINELPSESEIRRVAGRLTEGGWPVDRP